MNRFKFCMDIFVIDVNDCTEEGDKLDFSVVPRFETIL